MTQAEHADDAAETGEVEARGALDEVQQHGQHEADADDTDPEHGGPSTRDKGLDGSLSSGVAGDQGDRDHEDAERFGGHDRPFGAVQELHVGTVFFFAEAADGDELGSSGTGGQTRGDE